MALLPTNVLQNVQTFQKSDLAWLRTECVALMLSNKKFDNFQDKTGNLGDTVTFDLAPRAVSNNGLIVSFTPSQQRVMSLSVTQAANVSNVYSQQELIFNVEDYEDRFGEAAISEYGSKVEIDILQNFISNVRVNNPESPNHGQLVDQSGMSGPYRFFGDGITPLDSYQTLAQGIANFKAIGWSKRDLCGVLAQDKIPPVVGNGLNSFAQTRNNEIAQSWWLGDFAKCSWYESDKLPIHYAGNVGNAGTTLTLVSVNDVTGENITQLVFSGASASDAQALANGDLASFNFGVSGQSNVFQRQIIGKAITQQPVQFRVVAPTGYVASNGGGQVTVNIYPALVSAPTLNQNISTSLQPGMQVTFLPSHQAGIIMSGQPLYAAMPRLMNTDPFSSVETTDEETGISMQHYWGTQFGLNQKAYVWNGIWGSCMVPDNCMRVIYPISL